MNHVAPFGGGSRAIGSFGEVSTRQGGACNHRRPDADCRARACRLFAEVVGAPQWLLRWDETHHLQAHAHVGGRDYVLIASRDEEHEPVLLDKDAWDHVTHTFGDERRELLQTYALGRPA